MELVKNGMRRRVKKGFSWTCFFFGPFCMIYRGMWGAAFLLWILGPCTLWLFQLYYAFVANRNYCYALIDKGWEVVE